eukprot:11162604-Lingulodinium_polyedra.AAC.1
MRPKISGSTRGLLRRNRNVSSLKACDSCAGLWYHCGRCSRLDGASAAPRPRVHATQVVQLSVAPWATRMTIT